MNRGLQPLRKPRGGSSGLQAAEMLHRETRASAPEAEIGRQLAITVSEVLWMLIVALGKYGICSGNGYVTVTCT